MRVFAVFSLMAMALLPVGGHAASRDDENRIYIVRGGETLYGIAQRYLRRPQDHEQIRKLNRIRTTTAIPIGTRIVIPARLLRYKPLEARLISVRGDVTHSNGVAVKEGDMLREGAMLRTAARSFASIRLPDASIVSLPSGSTIRIARLRQYLLGNSYDSSFELVEGGMRSKVTPQRRPQDRFQVRTPASVSAVRGTEFRSRYESADSRAFTETLEGGVAVADESGAVEAQTVAAGFGLAIADDGATLSEKLLLPPQLLDPGKPQTLPQLRFRMTPVEGAAAYHVQIASDAGFIDRIADTRSDAADVQLDGPDDGRYFVRISAISAAGFEGMPETVGFRRVRNNVKATGSRDDNGWAFRWLTDSRLPATYRFQLFAGTPDGTPMVDEAGLRSDQITLSRLNGGTYFWRVASTVMADGEAVTQWTDFEKLLVAAE